MCYKTDEIAVRVKNVSKSYKIFNSPGKRLNYYLFKANTGIDFWALQDINFEIKKGETFGIIGKNGSGKSTILQILAGIIKQTDGNIIVNGRISALLELGSGFNSESTGYENIYMNAAILGVTKDKINEKIDDIIVFADIGDFINQPVKTYSSGMYVRLAFAVAINVDADIILIDEALAVGDVFFRQKCYARLNQLKAEGKTIILVTHGMGEVEQFCDRAVLLHKSKQLMLGRSQDVVKQYYLINQENELDNLNSTSENGSKNFQELMSKRKNQRFYDNWELNENVFYDLKESNEIGNGQGHFLHIGLFDEFGNARRSFSQGENAYFYYEVQINIDIEIPHSGITLYDQRNIIVHGKDTMQCSEGLPNLLRSNSIVSILQKISLDLAIGDYTFEVGFASIDDRTYKQRSFLSQEEIDANYNRICNRNKVGLFSVIPKKIGNPTKIGFHGCCDLQGRIEMKILE